MREGFYMPQAARSHKNKIDTRKGVYLFCGERGSRTYTFTEYHKTAND